MKARIEKKLDLLLDHFGLKLEEKPNVLGEPTAVEFDPATVDQGEYSITMQAPHDDAETTEDQDQDETAHGVDTAATEALNPQRRGVQKNKRR